jgi:hypothetical protein
MYVYMCMCMYMYMCMWRVARNSCLFVQLLHWLFGMSVALLIHGCRGNMPSEQLKALLVSHVLCSLSGRLILAPPNTYFIDSNSINSKHLGEPFGLLWACWDSFYLVG